MTCGHCATFHKSTLPKLKQKYIIEESTKNIVNIEEVYGAESGRGLRNSNYINNQIQIIESDEVIGSITSQEAICSIVLSII